MATAALSVAIWCLSALLVWIMIRVRVLDHPVARSAHAVAVPTGGGIGIMTAFMAGLLPAFMIWGTGRDNFPVWGFLGGLALLCLVSWYDDIRPQPAAVKLLAQCAAAVTIVVSLRLSSGGQTGIFDIIASIAWLVFMANCVNFMDGLNGLASGTILCACLMLAWLGPMTGAGAVMPVALVMAIAVTGFIPFNFPRARIFMGDVGSQGCGMVLGTLGLIMGHKGGGWGWSVMLLLLANFMGDVLFTLGRRYYEGESVMTAHRGHLYQIAHRTGLPCTIIAPLAWGGCLLGGTMAWMVRAGLVSLPLAFVLALGPQVAWAAYVIYRTRAHPIGLW
ncbi:MraY family glycosyltransferase [Novacetimonas cocois]|uniref:Glycosyl transferase n=1 Tax=Novacetimonas cocois TaxID=1747507 RepID=A0A365Z0G5_9PROT|nr:hypothetical protein [Novacetimonas cocois]RBM09228.1 hypothetical protein NJLHNGOC_02375 [Novacetimonas cocois]